MLAKSKKLVFLLLGCGVVLVVLFIIVVYQNYQGRKLRLTFCDIGQGDSILIQTPYHQDILIDGGPDSSVLTCLGNNLPFYDRDIELMILTHPHADHVVGLVPVLERYEVDQILLTFVKSGEPAYQEFLKIIEEKNIPTAKGLAGQVFELGPDLKLETLFPFSDLENQSVKNLNNSSIINKLIYQENSFLLTGDLEVEGEELLLLADKDLQADILKVGHHGSSTSSSQDFLAAVQPEIAVIQCGLNNKHGHPSLRTIRRLERLGAQIFRNDLDGEINLVSDGKDIICVKEN